MLINFGDQCQTNDANHYTTLPSKLLRAALMCRYLRLTELQWSESCCSNVQFRVKMLCFAAYKTTHTQLSEHSHSSTIQSRAILLRLKESSSSLTNMHMDRRNELPIIRIRYWQRVCNADSKQLIILGAARAGCSHSKIVHARAYYLYYMWLPVLTSLQIWP